LAAVLAFSREQEPIMRVTASNFKPLPRNTLKGFVDIHIVEIGLTLRECTWHEMNGRQWISPAGKPQLDKAGQPRLSDKGKPLYTEIAHFAEKKFRNDFSEKAVAAAERLLSAQSSQQDDERMAQDEPGIPF
jgi:hypothetical protein